MLSERIVTITFLKLAEMRVRIPISTAISSAQDIINLPSGPSGRRGCAVINLQASHLLFKMKPIPYAEASTKISGASDDGRVVVPSFFGLLRETGRCE
jgi:hypothetical protein